MTKKTTKKKSAKKKTAKKKVARKKRSTKSAVSDDLARGEGKVLPEITEKPGAPIGNQFWKARSKHGRDKIFGSPEILWEACLEYFEWVETNPLSAAELVKYQGQATLSYVPKMRAMTVEGLCLFLDIEYQTWRLYAGREDFIQVVTRAETVIKTQKFAGAAAEMLNPNIIARDLGLKDAHDHELGNKDGKPFEHKINHAGGIQFDRIKEKVDAAVNGDK